MNTNLKFLSNIVLFAISFSAFAEENPYPDFENAMVSVGAVFTGSPEFVTVQPVVQQDFLYQYAFRKKGYEGEVRVSAFPWEMQRQTEEENKQMFLTMILPTLSNVTGQEPDAIKGQFMMFPVEAVRSEFGADLGMAMDIEPHSDFGKGFKRAHMVAIWKKGKGMVFITILYNDVKKVMPVPLDIYYSVRFQ